MQIAKLTKATIEKIQIPAEGFTDTGDAENKYLRLRITAAGTRTWYLIRKVAGKVHFVKLGRYPETGVAEARKAAEDASAKLLAGDKPGRPKPDTMTFGDLFTAFIQEKSTPADNPKKKSWRKDQGNFNLHLQGLAGRRLVDIDRNTIVKLHARLTEASGPYTANRVLALVRSVFNHGVVKLEMPIKNPCRGVTMHREESRDRFLSGPELAEFFRVLHAEETPEQWRDFFMLALLTGARRSNVQSMAWEHLDLAGAVWRIPGRESKNKHRLQVVLSPPALEILNRRRQAVQGPFVFPARGKSGHIQEPKKPWRDILTRAGLKDLRIHDLRRTMGSWQLATGASIQVIGKTLGHLNSKTTEVYARMNLDPVRNAVNAATTAMLATMKE